MAAQKSFGWESKNMPNTLFKAGSTDLLMSDTTFNWVSDVWLGDYLVDYSYNSNGYLDSSIMQQWDALGAEWDKIDKNVLYRQSGGLLDSSIYLSWDTATTAWVNFSKSIYDVHSGLYFDSIVMQEWDTLATDWVNLGKWEFIYDGDDNQTEWLMLNWGGAAWDSAQRFLSTYADSLETQSITQYYFSDSGWVNMFRNRFTYDAGKLIIELYDSWIDPNWDSTSIDTLKYTGGLNTETVNYNFLTTALTESNYTYDANENLILEIETQWVDPDWDSVFKQVWIYESALGVSITGENTPKIFRLSQNYPNPFNPTTAISYSLERRSQVEITVYNLLGEKVKVLEIGEQFPGTHLMHWDGTDSFGHRTASGVYFYTIKAGDFTETKKMMLLK